MLHSKSTAILSLLIAALLCVLTGSAQPYYFRHYQVENGLTNSTVFCSTQDKKGFLWFGTREGLNRFDGYHFKVFNRFGDNSSAQSYDLIHCLSTDQEGNVWIGGQYGLFRFDEKTERLIRVNDSLIEINYIQRDNGDNLWFLSLNKVYCYNLRTRQLRSFYDADKFLATFICKAEDGTMWFSTIDGHIKKFDTATQTFTSYDVFSHSPAASSHWIECIRYAGDHQFLIGTTNQGLKSFDETSGQYRDVLIYNSDKTTIFVRDILQYGPEEFWLATESGIFIYNTRNRTFTNLRKKFQDPYSINDNAVYTLCKDSEGGVWVGTFFGGLNYYSRQYSSFQKYFPDNSSNSISGSAVREICEDQNHNVWIGTEDAGLNKLDPRTGLITQFHPNGRPTDISYSNIHGLLADGNDLWIGTFEHGLDRMDLRTNKVYRHYLSGPADNQLKSNFVLSIARTSDGQLVMGSSNGVYYYREKTDDFLRLPYTPGGIFVAYVMEDHEGTIWAGTHGSGVFSYNPRTGAHATWSNTASHKSGAHLGFVNAITEDSQGNLWFATEGDGVWKLSADRQTFSSFTTTAGLPSNFIFKVIEDNNKDVWASTSKGLACLHRGNVPITIYTRANGLLNDQFNYSSGYKADDGKLYFGSVKGMITFQPDDFVPNAYTPSVYITGFQVDNRELTISQDSSILRQSILFTNKLRLPYDQSSFSLDFTALSFTAPERTEYSYKMEGLDKTWTYLKSNRKVYFTNLAPGTYTFRVRAATGGKWGIYEKQLTVEVAPPFWMTTAAYVLYVLVFTALVGYIVRSYHRRTQIKKEKEIYEAKIDFFTNIAHEIRTPLTLIKGPVENLHEMVDELPGIKEDVYMMERNTNRLIALVNQILDFRQTETKGFKLDFTRVNVTALLQENFASFAALAKKKGLDYRFDHPDNDIYAMADEEALNKIFSNLFSNAIKYSEKTVLVSLERAVAAELTIRFSNDGPLIPEERRERIFEPFYRLKGNGKEKGTGIGLALARSLAELHEGAISVSDSPDPYNNFVFSLPLRPFQNRSPQKHPTIFRYLHSLTKNS